MENFQISPISLIVLSYPDFFAEVRWIQLMRFLVRNAWYENQYVQWKMDQIKFTEVTIALFYKWKIIAAVWINNK